MSESFLRKFYASKSFEVPSLHVVLGSGLGSAFQELDFKSALKGWESVGELKFHDIPGIASSTAPGHAGVFRYFRHKKTAKVLTFQVGRLHGYEGLDPREVIKPVMFARLAGTQTFVLTNAAGSLQKRFKVGSVMVLKDQVNLTGRNPLYGANPVDEKGVLIGPRFPDMSEVFDPKLSKVLKKSVEKLKVKAHEGTSLGLLGPAYETPAEVKLFSSWGLGAVGMSTVWESTVLRHSNARVCGFSFISNMGCGLVKREVLKHEDVEKEGKKIAKTLVLSLFGFGEKVFEKDQA